VTTYIGGEGMFGSFPWNGVIVDDPYMFAKSAIELYQSEELWLKSQLNGVTIVNQRFSKELFADDFKNTINGLLISLEKHRLNNFMGAMLQHHSLTSTKYMSRWIEEKNKIR
jgi:hypothetical protein